MPRPGARGRLMTRSLPIAVVQAERVPVEGAVDGFAASAAGVGELGAPYEAREGA